MTTAKQLWQAIADRRKADGDEERARQAELNAKLSPKYKYIGRDKKDNYK